MIREVDINDKGRTNVPGRDWKEKVQDRQIDKK